MHTTPALNVKHTCMHARTFCTMTSAESGKVKEAKFSSKHNIIVLKLIVYMCKLGSNLKTLLEEAEGLHPLQLEEAEDH